MTQPSTPARPSAAPWPATREAAFERLNRFLPQAGTRYAQSRNFDRGAGRHEAVSCLSPYLRHGLLEEPDVLLPVIARHGREAAAKFVDEVFWRTYFRGWMAHHPEIWQRYGSSVQEATDQRRATAALDRALTAAEQGQTGIPAFDHWAQELLATGYLHNHARMWFASIWIFTLRLPWVLGADWFLRQLMDGDPASNTLGWRWVAGLHTRGKTYLARRDNILRFTDGRLDPGPDLAREALALEDAPAQRETLQLPPATSAPPLAETWLVTDEFCGSLPDAGDSLRLGLACDQQLAAARGERAAGFSAAALGQAVNPGADSSNRVFATVDGLLSSPLAEGWQELHCWSVPFGPVAQQLDQLEAALAARGRRLVRWTRAHDARAWPHARRGFFGLKKRIPALLDRLEQEAPGGA